MGSAAVVATSAPLAAQAATLGVLLAYLLQQMLPLLAQPGSLPPTVLLAHGLAGGTRAHADSQVHNSDSNVPVTVYNAISVPFAILGKGVNMEQYPFPRLPVSTPPAFTLASGVPSKKEDPMSLRTLRAIRYALLEAGGAEVHVVDGGDEPNGNTTAASAPWQILWSYEYPYKRYAKLMKSLRPWQRVNHFAGAPFYFANKTNLVQHSHTFDFIPRAFLFPQQREEFRAFHEENPGHLWLTKASGHRGVQAISGPDLLDQEPPEETVIVQQNIHPPLLLDGRKFDVGVYVAVTSVDPLRVYTHREVLLRFCGASYPEEISPGTPEEAYVVGTQYTPPWEIPSFKLLLDQGMSYRHALEMVLRNHGYSSDKIFERIDQAILRLLTEFEGKLAKVAENYGGSHPFELFRFDFLIDQDLKPHLLEVNMSPNLSWLHFPRLRGLYMRVTRDLVSLAGLAGAPAHERYLPLKDKLDRHALSVEPQVCRSDPSCKPPQDTSETNLKTWAHASCAKEQCQVCRHCLTDSDLHMLLETLREWQDAKGFRTLYSSPGLDTMTSTSEDALSTGFRTAREKRRLQRRELLRQWIAATHM